VFLRGSRYEHIPEAEIARPGGGTIRYKRIRFIPEITGQLTYKVEEGDRPDLAAYRAIGDPEQFWRLCDVNRIRRPADLTAPPAKRIAVPRPGG
jgi:hypothetical protein